ncbi:MAG TPA: galactokinase, partial [Pyrinomonadaceae bacterium]|nr:galactokinase [Pyrinomonadaceae bacterium]
RETVVAAAPRDDRTVRTYSVGLNEELSFDLDHPHPPQRGVWLDYVEGVAQALRSRGVKLSGADLLIDSDVPAGAGLSSSAALEIAVGLALVRVSGQETDSVTLALAGQQAEHTYVGTLCGIMDQFVAALARERHALLIDCRSLEAEPVPLDTTEAAFVIADTRVKHELSSSEYNVRRAECARGVELLQERLPDIQQLRDVSPDDLGQHADLLPDTILRRCRHIVTENERTLAAARALRSGDLTEMGRLMYESHYSLRDDYEVSSPELDLLVEIARGLSGVLGARMTGGGFGGSTVSLVRRNALEEFERALSEAYERETGKPPAILVSEAGAGAAEVGK